VNPTIEMPTQLRGVANALAERERELREAEAAVEAADEEVNRAHARDIEEIAAAREAGEPDPPAAHHEEQARTALDAAQREHEIVQAQVNQLAADHARLLAELRPRWRGRVEKKWAETDATLRRRVEELGAAAGRQAELRATWLTITSEERGADPDYTWRKANASSAELDLSDVVAAIEQGSADVVTQRVTREYEAKVERLEAASAEHERQLEEARQAFAEERERIERRRALLSG
jgi:hypothetical protein